MKNVDHRVKAIHKSAELAFQPAQSQLATMYRQGIGVPKDLAMAEKWAQKGDQVAHGQLLQWLTLDMPRQANELTHYQYRGPLIDWQNKKALVKGTFNHGPIMPSLKKEEIFHAKLAFLKPTELPAFLVADHAKALLDTLPNNGLKLPDLPINKMVTKEQVKRLYGKALLGNRQAQFKLGLLHEYGLGVDKSPNAAAQWYFAAAKQDHLPSEYQLGLLFLRGDGVEQNAEKASYWLNRAAFKGYAKAQYALGVIYQHGYRAKDGQMMIKKDAEQANAMYHLASGDGYARAKYQLALLASQTPLSSLGSAHERKVQHHKRMTLFQEAYKKGITEAALPLAFYYIDADTPFDKQQWAYQALIEKSSDNNPYIHFLLGLMTERGIGTEADLNAAMSWYQKAAKQQLPIALFTVASHAYLNAKQTEDQEKALSLLRKAAESGLSHAYYNLAAIAQAKGDTSEEYLSKAAAAGNEQAKLAIADKIVLSTTSKFQLAGKVYEQLAKEGNENAALRLGYMHQYGLHYQKNIPLAKKYYLQAAAKENRLAQFQLGYMYQLGYLGKPAPKQASKWYAKAAHHAFVPAMVSLGFLYETQQHNYQAAYNWYLQAANANMPEAQYDLALVHDYGKAITVDAHKAFSLYKKAANAGLVSAKMKLAKFYLHGIGTNQSYPQAYQWFKKASLDQHPQSFYYLGLMHESGLGTPLNQQQALIHYQQALKLGYNDAAISLARLQQQASLIKHTHKMVEDYQYAANQGNRFAKLQLASMWLQDSADEKARQKAINLLNELSKENYVPARKLIARLEAKKDAMASSFTADKHQKGEKQEGHVAMSEFNLNPTDPNNMIVFTEKGPDAANVTYINAIKHLENGELYQSKAMLQHIVEKYPHYLPAQQTLELLNKQAEAIKKI